MIMISDIMLTFNQIIAKHTKKFMEEGIGPRQAKRYAKIMAEARATRRPPK